MSTDKGFEANHDMSPREKAVEKLAIVGSLGVLAIGLETSNDQLMYDGSLMTVISCLAVAGFSHWRHNRRGAKEAADVDRQIELLTIAWYAEHPPGDDYGDGFGDTPPQATPEA